MAHIDNITDEMICDRYESNQMRSCIRLMIARATSEERAIVPTELLPQEETDHLPKLMIQGYVPLQRRHHMAHYKRYVISKHGS